MELVHTTNFEGLQLPYPVRRGKVRDIYETDEYLLIVATDRISAFDVIMNEAIPEKGNVLSSISIFWFENTRHIIPNHYITNKVEEYPQIFHPYASQLSGRSMLVKKCKPLPIECIVRGYIAGSGWKEYKKSGTVCGIKLPEGLQEFSKIGEPVFTPSTKADVGHDENISVEKAGELVGGDLIAKVHDVSLKLYNYGAEYMEKNGIILPDTKFEFGLDDKGDLLLIDEALTPDSSRFWAKSEYAPGKPQLNFDKQILRDYLETLDWNKQPPPPPLPPEIIKGTYDKYKEALRLIVH